MASPVFQKSLPARPVGRRRRLLRDGAGQTLMDPLDDFLVLGAEVVAILAVVVILEGRS